MGRRRSLLVLLPLCGPACVPHTPSDMALIQQLDQEVLAARERNRTLEEQLQHCGETGSTAEIFRELSQVLSGTEVELERDGPRTAVIIPSDMLFGSDGIEVRQEATMVLDLLATALKLHPGLSVMVLAHTDDQPVPRELRRLAPDHWALSTAQARAVALSLIINFGVEETRLSVAGRGSAAPRSPNDTPAERARNRRVVVVIGPPAPWG